MLTFILVFLSLTFFRLLLSFRITDFGVATTEKPGRARQGRLCQTSRSISGSQPQPKAPVELLSCLPPERCEPAPSRFGESKRGGWRVRAQTEVPCPLQALWLQPSRRACLSRKHRGKYPPDCRFETCASPSRPPRL